MLTLRTRRRPRHRGQAKESPPPATAHQRLAVIAALALTACLVLGIGLGYRQLVAVDDLREVELRQNYRRIVIPGPRGNIYDRNGVLLVGNRPLFSAVVYLNDLRRDFRQEYLLLVKRARATGKPLDREGLNLEARHTVVHRYLEQVSVILGRPLPPIQEDIERHFRQNLLLPFPLVFDLSGEDYARLIEQLPVDSPIQVVTDSARFYPYGPLAAHVLGFVSSSTEIDDAELPGQELLTFRYPGRVGRSGLERSFDSLLQGRAGGEIWSVDPGGFQHERVEYQPPVKGRDLRTSLDVNLQMAAEEAFGKGKIGAVVAMDVNTGEILALASFPNFDLNQLSPVLTLNLDRQIREQEGWINRAAQGLYPPGSTFKLITACAALLDGATNRQRVITCTGAYPVGRRVFHCNRRAGHGEVNLVEAIAMSCNVYFYQVGLEMGIDPIAATARLFGLDQPTGIELPFETQSMLVPDREWKRTKFRGEGWYDGDTANVSIGQGPVLVTPLQMVALTASLARGETRTRPTLLVRQNPLAVHSAPIPLSPAQLELIRSGMAEAGRTGTARLASSPGFAVAGKTGTAQVRKDGRPTTLAWFTGYAPADDPRLAVTVLVEGVPEEETTYAGGATAAPIAGAIFRAFANNLQNPGDNSANAR